MDRREFLFQRRNRCVGKILGALEHSVFPSLTLDEQNAVRSVIKTNIANYHSDALDALEMETDTAINALAMKARDKVHGRGKVSSRS